MLKITRAHSLVFSRRDWTSETYLRWQTASVRLVWEGGRKTGGKNPICSMPDGTGWMLHCKQHIFLLGLHVRLTLAWGLAGNDGSWKPGVSGWHWLPCYSCQSSPCSCHYYTLKIYLSLELCAGCQPFAIHHRPYRSSRTQPVVGAVIASVTCRRKWWGVRGRVKPLSRPALLTGGTAPLMHPWTSECTHTQKHTKDSKYFFKSIATMSTLKS